MPFLGSPSTPRPYASKITPTFLSPGATPSKGKDPDPYSCRIFRHGSFFWGVRSDPDPCFHKLFGEVAPISHEPGRPRQALRYTTRGDGGRRVRQIKKTRKVTTWGRYRGNVFRGFPIERHKKGETLRALSASLSSVGLSPVMALWALQACALVGL